MCGCLPDGVDLVRNWDEVPVGLCVCICLLRAHDGDGDGWALWFAVSERLVVLKLLL